MNPRLTVLVTSNDGWWTAICEELDCAGSGPSQNTALENVAVSLSSAVFTEVVRQLKETPEVSLPSDAASIRLRDRGVFEHAERRRVSLGLASVA